MIGKSMLQPKQAQPSYITSKKGNDTALPHDEEHL